MIGLPLIQKPRAKENQGTDAGCEDRQSNCRVEWVLAADVWWCCWSAFAVLFPPFNVLPPLVIPLPSQWPVACGGEGGRCRAVVEKSESSRAVANLVLQRFVSARAGEEATDVGVVAVQPQPSKVPEGSDEFEEVILWKVQGGLFGGDSLVVIAHLLGI